MSGFRAYFASLKSAQMGVSLSLDAAESRHLCGALRAKNEDEVEVFDLCGNVAFCKIVRASPKSAELEVLNIRKIERGGTEIILAQCLLKGRAFDDIIAVAVQLGVSKICPIISERTIVRLDSTDAQNKCHKWQIQAVEAMKQSANLAKIDIALPQSLSSFLGEYSTLKGSECVKIVASLEAQNPPALLSALEIGACASVKRTCILIGPEGDFSGSEYACVYEAGFAPVSLGANVLTSHTAACFAMSVASAYFGAHNLQ